MAIGISNALRSATVDGITGFLSGTNGTKGTAGILCVYDGSQPATGGSTSGCALLVQISGIAWSAGTGGTAVITGNKTGTAGSTSTATWARLSDVGKTYIIDGDVVSDFILDSADITEDAVVTLTAATIVQPEA